MPLGAAVLQRLTALGKDQAASIPVYDKSAREGRGDRAEEKGGQRSGTPIPFVLRFG